MSERTGLRAADRLLLPAVRAAVADLDVVEACDVAAVRLAETLAAGIDDADPDHRVAALRDLAPKLLAVLVELGATPKARKTVVSGGGSSAGTAPPSPLGRLRSAHRQ